MTAHKPTLIIHGASSFTATELLSYLDSHPQGDQFEFILAGRTRSKLEAKNAELGIKRQVEVVDLTDERSVRALVEKGDVVLNLAGPFRWFNAEALIAECARTGKHYVDLAGESDWLGRHIIPKYNYLASKTGACIIPSCGFDSVPSDMILYNALSTLQSRYPNESITRSLTMFKIRGVVSGGTLASMRSVAELSPEERSNSEWAQTASHGPSRDPMLFYTLPSLPGLSTLTSRIGAFFFMYPYNRTIVRRSWFLSRTAEAGGASADGGKGKEPVHGDSLQYEEAFDVGGGKFRSALVTFAMGMFFGLFMASSWFRKFVDLISPGGDVSPERLRNGSTALLSVADTTRPGTYIETTYTGQGDPGYWHTCHLIAESALALVLPPPEGTCLPPLGQRGGCLTPSTGLGMVLVRRLRESGKVAMESRVIVVDDDDEGKKRR